MEEWLTTDEAAKRLGFKRSSSVRHHIHSGFKDYIYKDNRTILVNIESLTKWCSVHNRSYYNSTRKGIARKKKEFTMDLNSLKEPLHEKMSDYTKEELNYIKAHKCKYCIYAMTFQPIALDKKNYSDGLCCGYEILTHMKRPTRAELCQMPYKKNAGDDIDAGEGMIAQRNRIRMKRIEIEKGKK